MISLSDAFAFTQENYPEYVARKAFPRLRHLSRNGEIDESIFQAVTFAAYCFPKGLRPDHGLVEFTY